MKDMKHIINFNNVATLALGSRPRQGFSNVWAKIEPGSHVSCSRECKNCEEWTFTFTSKLPFWELKFQWTPKFSEGDCKGQNSLDRKVLYIIEKLLELRCFSNGLAWPIWTTKTQVMAKRRVGSQIDNMTANH
jgi:hypothetical protein